MNEHYAWTKPDAISLQPDGVQQITGLLRSQEAKGAFTPENSPQKGQWLFEDLQQMADYVGHGCEPVLVDEVFGQWRGPHTRKTFTPERSMLFAQLAQLEKLARWPPKAFLSVENQR